MHGYYHIPKEYKELANKMCYDVLFEVVQKGYPQLILSNTEMNSVTSSILEEIIFCPYIDAPHELLLPNKNLTVIEKLEKSIPRAVDYRNTYYEQCYEILDNIKRS